MIADKLKITIITVCFNSRATISDCIASVVSQDFEAFEYIIIDGGSTDGTLSIIEENSHRIHKFLSEPDEGLYDAMNKGLSLAEGRWILFLNSDDKLANPSTLSEAAPFLEDEGQNYYGIAKVEHEGTLLYQKPVNMRPIDFKRDLPIHQTVFLSRSYKEKPFDTRYHIAADSIYLYELSTISDFSLIPVVIAKFNLGGISSWHPNVKALLLHLSEHLTLLRLRKSPMRVQIYTIIAFTFKFLMGKILSKNQYFKMVGHVAQFNSGR